MAMVIIAKHMGLSENSVPLKPLVNDQISLLKMAISLGIYPIFR